MTAKQKVDALILAGNTATGESRTDLTAVVQDLVDGYGQGGDDEWITIDVDEVSSPVSFDVGYNDYSNIKSSAKETQSGRSLTSSITCNIGDTIFACFAVRTTSTNVSISSGWTLISLSNYNSSDQYYQRMGWAYKVATSTTESITITQPSSARLYINMIALTPDENQTIQFVENGYNYKNDASGQTITCNKPSGIVLWGASAPLWSTSSFMPVWKTSVECFTLQLGSSTQSRLLCAVDKNNESQITFTAGTDTQIIVGSLTITGTQAYTEVSL